MNKFSKNLEGLLETRGMKPADLARKLKMSKTTVSKWLNGARPSQSNLESIAKLFNVTEDRLLYGEKQELSEDAIKQALAGLDRVLEEKGLNISEEKKYAMAAYFIKYVSENGSLPPSETIAAMLYIAK